MDELMPYFKVFAASGGVLLVALVAMLLPILKFAVQSLSEEVVEDNFDGVKVQTDYK